jgi:hypothetical protein
MVDEGGSREFEVLIPRWRRPGLLAEIKSQCAAAGVRGTVRTIGHGQSKKKVLMLTVPADVDHVAFARFSSWIYVRVGTRPYDTREVAAHVVPRRTATAAGQPMDRWSSKEFKVVVGRMVRKEFLRGVDSICAATGARWEWRVERKGLTRTTLITISGPGSVVAEAARHLLDWQRRFAPVSGE